MTQEKDELNYAHVNVGTIGHGAPRKKILAQAIARHFSGIAQTTKPDAQELMDGARSGVYKLVECPGHQDYLRALNNVGLNSEAEYEIERLKTSSELGKSVDGNCLSTDPDRLNDIEP